ncbi:SLC13 family permease [Allochromatium palmeri]|uniref:SLC13 family permease n=1 Tax=Allochromatium palmeri TaxID=231048 RepID=A0A6N8EE90_9GAMM|nr:SLC13 family permease [Allochromatium palmeri]MTW20837.1 SLC13 family permease [Allochromatium palmeri]
MLDAIRALSKTDIAAAAFAAVAIYLAGIVPTPEIAWVSAFLLLTIFLFAFEVLSVDVAAITVMVLLGLTSLAAPLMGLQQGLVPVEHLFDGFASNAVISIIAVMIVGAGLDKTGIMSKVATFIIRVGGSTETRIIPLISGTVGTISSFMQNVGAAALFLPVVSRISARTGLPMSRLLMPMGFCAILGGTITMVGSSPLILLNDLILTSNTALPESVAPMKTFDLFDVTPIGLALLLTGIVYFVLAGRLVLPAHGTDKLEGGDTSHYFAETYGLTNFEIGEFRVPNSDSHLIGMSVDELEQTWRVRLVAVEKGDGLRFGADSVDRTLGITPGCTLALLGTADSLLDVANANTLTRKRDLDLFAESMSPTKAGVAEIVIPPGSTLIGKTARDVWMRKTYGLSLLAINRGGTQITYKTGGVRNTPFAAGDALVVHTTWADLARLEQDRNFVVVTTEYPHEELRPHKVPAALALFVLTISLILFTELRLSVALLVGALGMVLTRVLTIDEAYQAVSWKTVFLLASLIPLGLAVEQSGTAAWIAGQTLAALGDVPIWVVQAALAVLATAFTLVMSNVGATVLLVPLAVNMALGAGADPAVFALTVAIATSNSFLIPTHQVNALIMGPGGYRVTDYMRAGGIMTVLFLVVALTMLNLVM